MTQQTKDAFLLSTWAGPGVSTPQQGYAYIVSTRQISRNAAKKLVHQALERRGANPHSGPGVVSAWLQLHKGYVKRGETE